MWRMLRRWSLPIYHEEEPLNGCWLRTQLPGRHLQPPLVAAIAHAFTARRSGALGVAALHPDGLLGGARSHGWKRAGRLRHAPPPRWDSFAARISERVLCEHPSAAPSSARVAPRAEASRAASCIWWRTWVALSRRRSRCLLRLALQVRHDVLMAFCRARTDWAKTRAWVAFRS